MKAACLCTLCALTSITQHLKPKQRTASSASKCGSTKATHWAATMRLHWLSRVPKKSVAPAVRAVMAVAPQVIVVAVPAAPPAPMPPPPMAATSLPALVVMPNPPLSAFAPSPRQLQQLTANKE